MRILITGGTGTFGNAAVSKFVSSTGISRVIVYSRDEQKQEAMYQEFCDYAGNLAFFVGDVRDQERLEHAFMGVDIVIHAAAMKIVTKCEFDPIEAVKTNVNGTANVVYSAINAGVKKVVLLSTDKAVSPANLYGATKLTAEKIFIAANNLTRSDGPKFSVVRYGNVTGSRGSVIPLFRKLHADGKPLPITSPDMTRFWITPQEAVAFVMDAINEMNGGEIFIPRMPAYNIMDLAQAITGSTDFDHKIIGLRQGEKIHETMIADNEWPYVIHRSCFVINRSLPARDVDCIPYTSGNTELRLPVSKLAEMLA